MGCPDFIEFNCPSCGNSMRAQSKGDEDMCCRSYHYKEVPYLVAIDANRHAPYMCDNCGNGWKLLANIPNVVDFNIVECVDV
jgi:hypothetical protein